MGKILVIGSKGQIGTELTFALRKKYGDSMAIAADLNIAENETDKYNVQLNVLDKFALHSLVLDNQVTEIYHLAAILSVMGEKHPIRTWDVNMHGLLNVLEVAKTERIKVFWPSSIAVFGHNSPREVCPQHTITEPGTIYGISKLAGEQWCQYYYHQYGVDIRSLRLPGLISYTTKPGGGTTDYAVDIFHQAIERNAYTCYLEASTSLPMMYMDDAIRAIIELMISPAERITIRAAYNIMGCHFSPSELAKEISRHLPGFKISYRLDHRQQIADSWPASIDDRFARKDWGWSPEFNLEALTKEMLKHLRVNYT